MDRLRAVEQTPAARRDHGRAVTVSWGVEGADGEIEMNHRFLSLCATGSSPPQPPPSDLEDIEVCRHDSRPPLGHSSVREYVCDVINC